MFDEVGFDSVFPESDSFEAVFVGGAVEAVAGIEGEVQFAAVESGDVELDGVVADREHFEDSFAGLTSEFADVVAIGVELKF